MYMHMYMNNLSRDAEKGKATTTTQQKGKAAQHNSPETVIFQRKIGCLGWDSNNVHVYVYMHTVCWNHGGSGGSYPLYFLL